MNTVKQDRVQPERTDPKKQFILPFLTVQFDHHLLQKQKLTHLFFNLNKKVHGNLTQRACVGPPNPQKGKTRTILSTTRLLYTQKNRTSEGKCS